MGVSSHKSVEEINRIMIKYVPELKSSYAKYPLNRNRWYEPNEKGPKGEPCFIPVSNQRPEENIKLDYVYGAGPYGFGYYSLLTKYSYDNLYRRVESMPPPSDCCFCFRYKQQTRKEYDDYDDVKRLMYNRKVSPKPNDTLGAQAALSQAQHTAQLSYQTDQNVQLGMGIVQTNINLNM